MEDVPLIPPGFSSLTSFALQKIQQDSLNGNNDNAITIEKFRRSLRHKPWVNYGNFDDDDSDEDEIQKKPRTIETLPKGVIRGCSDCENCQKVLARWRPDESCKPILDEVPVFYPTEEEFEDILNYIEKIRAHAEKYGICRIIPPNSWAPPCPLKDKNIWENSKFATRVQQIDKLQTHEPVKKNQPVKENQEKKKREILERENQKETGFGFLSGPDFTLKLFQNYADSFKEQYFQNENLKQIISVDDVEGEYWRIIEKPTESIEVLYGADLDTSSFGSGFPKESNNNNPNNSKYIKSEWNLNNIRKLPNSVLCFENGNIPGVQIPWLYIGMCFSSFCWHVEDHHLYSLNYHHFGDPKVWYGVPRFDAVKLEGVMKKYLPHLFENQPDLLHNLFTQFSPNLLKKGVSVYKCVQKAGEFVLTFPRAYHSGFNSGFNCAEAVNIAPIDWLPHGQIAVELYREQKRTITLSHDKLLISACNEAVKAQWFLLLPRAKVNSCYNLKWKRLSGVDGLLTRTLYNRVNLEKIRREFLSLNGKCNKMGDDFDLIERECLVCHFDLYLSAIGCMNCANKFACLIHAKSLCNCEWISRYFLFRYNNGELSLLFDALGGKPSAIHKWGSKYLGFSLSKSRENNSSCLEGSRNSINEVIKDNNDNNIMQSRNINGILGNHVEVLEYGVVLRGKLWCTSKTLFPKGYRSRVRYWSVIEPDKICYYVSKILDAGFDAPIFMVSVEECPSEVFMHLCPNKCWNLVRERVIKENKKLKNNLLQDPESIDGFEMFGLSSLKFLQEIREKGDKKDPKLILEGLFKKGSLEELHALKTVLEDSIEASKLVAQEIESRHRLK